MPRLTLGVEEAVSHGGHRRLAHLVPVRQAAHAVGHHRQQSCGVLRRGYKKAVLLPGPGPLLVELFHGNAPHPGRARVRGGTPFFPAAQPG